MKLVLFYLTNSKRHYTFQHFINLISSSKYSTDWILLVLTDSDDTDFYESILSKSEIKYKVVQVDSKNNYMNKVSFATNFAQSMNIPYMMKCDNDIFITSTTLDGLIDNLPILDSNNHLTLSPILTTGIPTVEYFASRFLPCQLKEQLERLYLETEFYDRDYSFYATLNKYTLESSSWNSSAFFKGVNSLVLPTKGIHPIRFNTKGIKLINSYILENKSKFLEARSSGLILTDDSPYLCNSVYCIKTNTYSTIINDKRLFLFVDHKNKFFYIDGYDELALNAYAKKNSCNHVFLDGCFGIHMYYNWYPECFDYEKEFCEKMFNT